ncbi:MAG: single-stranded DNA-binding protein [Actinomycetota bacterium]|nr:single-stranded DNA-binding protein [Actinomycetota bacterium]
MAENINRVTITGNLTADPELRHTGSGTAVVTLRVAVNGRRKDQSGQWVDKPNYFNVTVWGAQGENCKNYLSRGRPVAVDGRLDWREWEAKDGSKRQTVEIVADTVQFLGSRDGSAPGGQNGGGGGGGGFAPASDVPADTGDFAPSGGGGAADDDIPF